MNRRRVLLNMKNQLLVLLLSLSIFLINVSPKALADPLADSVRIYLEPSNYVFSPENATIGTLFNITVWVESDAYPFNLMMWQLYIAFNNSIIMPTFYYSTTWEETIPLTWPNDDMGGRNFNESYVFYGKSGGMTAPPYYYNLGVGSGALRLGDTLLTNATIDAPKILCIIQFNITAIPTDGYFSCALGINNEDTYLYDYNGPIPYEVVKEDGTYIFVPEFSMFTILTVLLLMSIGVAIAKNKLHKNIPKNIC